jgi:hypothetical protein
MDILAGLAGLVAGAVMAWQLVRWRAAAELSRLRAQMDERIGYWQDETERARATASRLSERTAAWVAGCQQGREDVLSLARALAQHGAQADDELGEG